MKKQLLTLFGAALFFAACDDDSSTTSVNAGVEKVSAFEDAGKCDKDAVGRLVYVSDSVKVYACTDDGWTAFTGTAVSGQNGNDGHDGADGKDGSDGKDGVNGKDGKNGTDGKNGANGKDGSDGKDGANGKDGKDGKDGADGTSCTVVALADSSGYKVICGKDSVGVLKNGAKGEQGEPGAPGTPGTNGTNGTNGSNGKDGAKGADGSSCKIASDVDGVVTIQCGEGENATTSKLYKAMCGTQPYDPEKNLCKEGNLFYGCGKEIYDPETEFCYEDKKYAFCEGGAYDPSEKFCRADKLYDLCNGKVYNLASEFCYENKRYIFCEGGAYNPSEKFCVSNKLYALCGGKDYDPVTYQCENDVVVVRPNLCGDVGYDLDKEFCAEFNGGAVKQVYKKVTVTTKSPVYSKTWMAENLKYETKNSSCYKEDESNCNTYGRLYAWTAADACPDGWHLPSNEEWNELINAVGGVGAAASVLKSKKGWKESNGTDNYGFSVLPGGEYFVEEGNPKYDYILENASFWTSKADGTSRAYGILFNNVQIYANDSYSKNDRFSVRCIMDE